MSKRVHATFNKASRHGRAVLTAWALVAGSLETTARECVVTVSAEPAQTMSYGMDFERLWSWGRLRERQKLAEAAVRDCRVDYVRVAVNGGAELEEGRFDPAAYEDILEVMAFCKEARPDIKFFGSPRPIDEAIEGAPWNCYPPWVSGDMANAAATAPVEAKPSVPVRAAGLLDSGELHESTDLGLDLDEADIGVAEPDVALAKPSTKPVKWRRSGFQPEKAADYLARYVRFMKEKGFTISYLDLKNECCPRMRPAALAVTARRLREQLGADTPLLVAPSGFDYMIGGAWVKEAQEGPGTEFFDILSTHNTRGADSGNLEEFVALGRQLGKPVWNTELHGWRGNDAEAVTNTVILFHQIRSGVNALNDWLSLGNEKKDYKMFRAMKDGSLEVMRIYYIYKQLVNTSGGGRYVPTNVPAGLTSTAAFLRDDLMTVWLLNGTDTEVPGVKVDLGGRVIAGGRVKTLWWDPNNGREGSLGEAKPTAANTLVADVGAQTLLCIEFKVKLP